MSDIDDHADFANDVRAALAQHSSDQPSQAYEESASSENADAQRDHDMGLAVVAQLDREEQQRSEPSGKLRNARGRFISSGSSIADTAHDDAAGVVPSPAASSLKPPTSWSPEAKADWDRLPSHLQQAIAIREAEMDRGVQDYRGRIQQHEQIESMLAPRRQTFQQYGLKSDSEAIERLLMVSDGLGQNPAGTIAFLAQQFGIGPQQLFPGMQQSGPSQQQIEHYKQMARAEAEVERFEANAPEHYSLVKPLMRQLLEQGHATDMQHAYKLACQHHPAVLSIEQQRQDRARLEKKIRASGHSLDGAPHGVAATPPRSNGRSNGKFGDVADDVRAALASLS